MRTDRNRQTEALEDLDRLPDDQQDGAGGLLLQTFAETAYPTSAASVYACHALLVDAADTEGASPSFSAASTDVFYALNIGSVLPPENTKVIASAVGGRWVFAYSTPP